MFISSSTLLVCFCAVSVNCAKILGVFYSPETSHFMAGNTLMKILAENGHEVTVMSPFSEKNPPNNYREIYLDGLIRKIPSRKKNVFETKMGPFSLAFFSSVISTSFLNRTMAHPKFQELLHSNSTFDLVIIEQFSCDALMYLATHFKAPLIGFSTLDASFWTNRYVANPTSPAYIPDILFSHRSMSYLERMKNLLMFTMKEILFHFKTIPAQNEILQYNVPGAPHLKELIYNISITFLNADVSIQDAMPKVPNMIDIGGFHIQVPKILPKDIQEILDNAKNGVIYFSLGTSAKSKDIPSNQLEAIIDVFSKKKETVLWKWENEKLPGKSDNVVIRKWMPQQDILRHPNVKVFITHGGLFSSMESIYNGIPMLIIPIKADQDSNAARATEGGYAITLQFLEITSESFNKALTNLLENQVYKRNAEKRSLIMRTKPVSPRETILFWVENIIKNHGASHLRVASLNMPWYQNLLLDVLAFILVLTIILLLLIMYAIKYLINCCTFQKGKRKIN